MSERKRSGAAARARVTRCFRGGPWRTGALPHGHRRARHKPNVIVILLDDLGMGELGCYGQQVIQTPVIDQLASQSVRFTQAYANSVGALDAGLPVDWLARGHATIRSNQDALGGFAPDDVTVAEVVRSRGRYTGRSEGDSTTPPTARATRTSSKASITTSATPPTATTRTTTGPTTCGERRARRVPRERRTAPTSL